jgi:hypothetical protein
MGQGGEVNEKKQYLIYGVLVEAVKSEGSGFYDLTIPVTGDKQRYLADVFEDIAMPLGACATHRTPHPKNADCREWSHV